MTTLQLCLPCGGAAAAGGPCHRKHGATRPAGCVAEGAGPDYVLVPVNPSDTLCGQLTGYGADLGYLRDRDREVIRKRGRESWAQVLQWARDGEQAECSPAPREVLAALERLLRAEEKFVRDTGLPQPDDLIQAAVNEARALLGWPALGMTGSEKCS